MRVCADDEAAEGGEVVGAGIARRDAAWSCLECDQLVGRNADRRAVREDVRVQVDQARRHELAGGVEHAQRACGRDVGLERLDHAEADADVALAAQVLARIEHVAALDDEIELVVRPHGGARTAAVGRHRECAGSRTGQHVAP